MPRHPCYAAILALLAWPCAAKGDPATTPQGERLVVFVNPTAAPLAFAKNELREIRSLAERLNLPIRVIDVIRGAPPEIAVTPLIVFQNHRGRSIYQGRYTSIERIRTFVRTARAVAQSADPLTLKNSPVWTAGRARIAASIKVAPVTGTPPQSHDHEPFAAQAAQTIASALQRFRSAHSVDLRRTDRRF